MRGTWKMCQSGRARSMLASIAVVSLGLSLSGLASTVPTFDVGESLAGETHIVGTPTVAGSPFSTNVTIGTPSLPQAPTVHMFNFPSGALTGTTVATNGLAESATGTGIQLGFAAGTGVTQTDPNHAETASTLGCNFYAVWDIGSGTTFGPPLNGSFSIPIGAKVSAGGSASFNFDVHWDLATNGSVTTADIRPSYSASVTYTNPGTYLTSFTAPAGVFNPSSISNPGGESAQIIMTGAFFFSADNDSGPALIEFPNGDYQNFPTLLTTDSQYDFAPTMGTDASVSTGTPEPSVTVLLLGAGAFLLADRKARSPLQSQR
jgi:hypothetical protein